MMLVKLVEAARYALSHWRVLLYVFLIGLSYFSHQRADKYQNLLKVSEARIDGLQLANRNAIQATEQLEKANREWSAYALQLSRQHHQSMQSVDALLNNLLSQRGMVVHERAPIIEKPDCAAQLAAVVFSACPGLTDSVRRASADRLALYDRGASSSP